MADDFYFCRRRNRRRELGAAEARMLAAARPEVSPMLDAYCDE